MSPTNTKREEGTLTNYWSFFNMADKYSFNLAPPSLLQPALLGSLLPTNVCPPPYPENLPLNLPPAAGL